MTQDSNTRQRGWSRWIRRGPWENAATVLICVGIFMIAQPFSFDLYSYSFLPILAGTLAFLVVSHFPR